jgi:transcriptional regulator with XRE-family HTH domain
MSTASTGEDRERELAASEEPRRGDIPADTFANRLLLARTHAGWLTVKEAAERCGLNYGSWSNWERGARPRDLLDVAQKVADGLRIDHEWLLFGGPLLGARGRPAKRASEVNDDYRHSTRRMSITTERLLEPRPIVRTDPASSIKTCVAGRRAVRVNPVRLDDRSAHVIYTP